MKKEVFLSALCVIQFIVLSSVLYSASLDQARENYQNGVFSISRSDPDSALSNFLLVAAITNRGSLYDSYKSRALYLAGDVYISRKDYSNAATAFSLVGAHYPLLPEAVYSEYKLGTALCAGGYYTKAVHVITNYLERRKDKAIVPAQAMYWLAKAYCGLGDFYSALSTYESILKNYPDAQICYEVRKSMRLLSYEKSVLKVKDLVELTNITLAYETLYQLPVFEPSAVKVVQVKTSSASPVLPQFTASFVPVSKPPEIAAQTSSVVSTALSSYSASIASSMSSAGRSLGQTNAGKTNESAVSTASSVSRAPVAVTEGKIKASVSIEFAKPVDMSNPGIMLVYLDDQYIGSLESLKKDEQFVMPDFANNTNATGKNMGEIKTGLYQGGKRVTLKAEIQPLPMLRIFYHSNMKRSSFNDKDLREDMRQIRNSIITNDLPKLGARKDMPFPPVLLYFNFRLLYEEKLNLQTEPEPALLLTPEGFIIELAGKLVLKKVRKN